MPKDLQQIASSTHIRRIDSDRLGSNILGIRCMDSGSA
jgi:hypothetical protein